MESTLDAATTVFKGASGPTVAAGVVGAGLVAYAAMGSSKTAIYPPEEKMNKPLPKDVTGPNGFGKQWRNAQGLNIYSYFWPAENPKGIAVLVHGHGSYTIFEWLASTGTPGLERVYNNSWVEELNKQGFSCCGMDVQSMGRSESVRGVQSYFDDFQDLVDDLGQFTKEKIPELGGEKFSSDLPKFIFGVSMGGCLSSTFVLQNPNVFKAAILLAPMLSLERVSQEGLNPYLKPLADFMAKVAPTARLAKTPKNEKFPHLQIEFEQDPHCDARFTRVKVASIYLKTTTRLLKSLGDFKTPFITFHSSEDTFVDPESSQKLVERAGSAKKEYVKADGMWHLLVHEKGNRKLLERSLKFVEEVMSG